MGSSTSSVPDIPQSSNTGFAQSGIASAAAQTGAAQPAYQQAYYQQATNPYAGRAVAGSQVAGNAMVDQGNANLANASTFQGVPQQLQPYIAQTLNTAYDPQQALYHQQLQGTMDQTNAQLAQSGLTSSPWGAGIANQANQNFNINWLQSQLAREQTGANTAAGLLGAGGTAATTGATLGQNATNQIATGYAMPYQTSTGVNQDTASMLSYLTAVPQMQSQDYASLASAANAQNATAVQAGSANNQNMANIGSGIGNAAGMLMSWV